MRNQNPPTLVVDPNSLTGKRLPLLISPHRIFSLVDLRLPLKINPQLHIYTLTSSVYTTLTSHQLHACVKKPADPYLEKEEK